jgi:Domain of unknown function (DUF4399)
MRSPTSIRLSAFMLLCMAGLFSPAMAQKAEMEGPASTSALHPWQATLPRLAAEAYFTNLKDGDKIETPFLVKFGLSGGWGLAPIAKPSQGKSGHHHLLINRPLPLNFKEALPFNDQYIHFGKGQMETVLTLPPGSYTLRMLLADQNHLPHFVYSKSTTITITKKTDKDPKSLPVKGISVAVASPVANTSFRVQFHASGFNVAHLSQQEKDTGHFKLTATSKETSKSAEFDFTNGQTEVWLAPPAGDYTLKLELLDNVNPGKVLAGPVTTTVKMQ